jgi:uncharacterized protein YqgC (DUF456 family)
MEAVAVKTGLVLLYLFLSSCLILTVLGLGGNWVVVGVAVILKLAGVGDLTWWWLLAMAALAGIGELVESFLGVAVVARKGGTRWGVVGSFAGGILGAVVGSSVVPPVGSLVGALVGAFAGAALGEFYRHRHVDSAVRIGWWSFLGRGMATAFKLAIGMTIIAIVVIRTW